MVNLYWTLSPSGSCPAAISSGTSDVTLALSGGYCPSICGPPLVPEVITTYGGGALGADPTSRPPGAPPAVLAYLFHRIADRLDGRTTLLIIDEGWLALDDKGFADQLREWLKTLRKKNASVVFATQSLADIDGSAIAPSIIESCPTRILLPNERALEPQIAAIYRRFGLNDRQIDILARATPKRDYYCQSRRGNRLFELGLSEVALALTAASSKTDQAAIARIFAEHKRAGFAAAWLRHKGLDWALPILFQKETNT